MSNRAIEAADEILDRFGYITSIHLPIDIKRIAQEHKIMIRMQSLEDAVSGVLVIKEGYAIVGVNEGHHPNRQRFTLAHEVGHLLLHSRSSKVFIDASPVFFRDEKSSEGTELQEIEANAFAAELLMPRKILKELIRKQPVNAFDEVAIRRLADQCGVSVQALTIQLMKLQLITS